MPEERNQNQIIRIDARNCFVESLNDSFGFGKAHFTFASYDLSKPSGQRQTNSIQIYIDIAELLELCRKLAGGELRYMMQNRKRPVTPRRSFNTSVGLRQRSLLGMVAQERTVKACQELHSLSAAAKRIFFSWPTAAPAKPMKRD